MDFRPLVFGTFGECSSNVKAVIEMAVEYGVDHLGRTMAATTVDASRIEVFRKRVGIWIMIIAVGIIYRILYEFSTDKGEVANNSGLYRIISTAVDFYPIQVVKICILP
jgi:hypothetical protein